MTDSSENRSKGRFTQSGNPRGRPKGYTAFRKAFRNEGDNLKQREVLKSIIESGEPKDQLNAIRLWWEYGWGRAPASPEDHEAAKEALRPLVNASSAEILAALASKGDAEK